MAAGSANSGWSGVAYTDYKSEYGIPGAHVHEHEEEHDEEHEDEHEGSTRRKRLPVSIDLQSQRTEVEIAGRDPFPGFEQIKLRYVDTQYEHTEYEGDETGTVFNSDSDNSRLGAAA